MRTTTTLQIVEAPSKSWREYRGIALDELMAEVVDLGASLRGARVLHVNATSYGGGVAELLASEVGLLRDSGLEVEWRVICPDARLFEVTKRMHNAMQGKGIALTEEDRAIYLQQNEHCARMLGDEWDVIVVHDPQPAALIRSDPAPSARWIWRCHIDTSSPDPAVWSFLRPFVSAYAAQIFTLASFAPPELAPERLSTIAPAIDPLSTKNRALPRFLTRSSVAGAGIDLARPLVVQVSRFDPWKDPLGVVDAWRLARRELPGLQLALVGAMADDDPEAWAVYDRVLEATASEPDCHLLTNQTGIGALEVNAFQREADIVVQKSLREGFGLTVSEALWKETPVIGGDAGGIPLQIGDDEGGILVTTIEACADAILALLNDAELAEEKGRAGRERVRRSFLVPRLVRDDLALYAGLLSGDASTSGARQSASRAITPPSR